MYGKRADEAALRFHSVLLKRCLLRSGIAVGPDELCLLEVRGTGTFSSKTSQGQHGVRPSKNKRTVENMQVAGE